jgi:hypothetical protein
MMIPADAILEAREAAETAKNCIGLDHRCKVLVSRHIVIKMDIADFN